MNRHLAVVIGTSGRARRSCHVGRSGRPDLRQSRGWAHGGARGDGRPREPAGRSSGASLCRQSGGSSEPARRHAGPGPAGNLESCFAAWRSAGARQPQSQPPLAVAVADLRWDRQSRRMRRLLTAGHRRRRRSEALRSAGQCDQSRHLRQGRRHSSAGRSTSPRSGLRETAPPTPAIRWSTTIHSRTAGC